MGRKEIESEERVMRRRWMHIVTAASLVAACVVGLSAITGTTQATLTPPVPGDVYVSLPQATIYSATTRGQLPANSTATVQVLGLGGVPSSSVSAVALKVGTPAEAQIPTSELTIWPSTGQQPSVPSLYIAPSNPWAVITVPLQGSPSVKIRTSGSKGAEIAVVGYYTPSTSVSQTQRTRFRALDAIRVLDTNAGIGGTGSTIAPNSSVNIPVRELATIPDDAESVYVEVAASPTTPGANSAAFASLALGQGASTVTNFSTKFEYQSVGKIAGFVPLSMSAGEISVKNTSDKAESAIVTVYGYLTKREDVGSYFFPGTSVTAGSASPVKTVVVPPNSTVNTKLTSTGPVPGSYNVGTIMASADQGPYGSPPNNQYFQAQSWVSGAAVTELPLKVADDGTVTLRNSTSSPATYKLSYRGVWGRDGDRDGFLRDRITTAATKVVDATDPMEATDNGDLARALWTNYGRGVAECMDVRGFTYSPPSYPTKLATHPEPSSGDGYGVASSVTASTSPTQPAQVAAYNSLSSDQKTAYANALRGTTISPNFDPIAHDGVVEPDKAGTAATTGGCEGLVRAVIVTPAVSEWQSLGVAVLNHAEDAQVENQPQLVAAENAWSDCMTGRGYDYGDPDEPFIDLSRQASGLMPTPTPSSTGGPAASVQEMPGEEDPPPPPTSSPTSIPTVAPSATPTAASLSALSSSEQQIAAADSACRGSSGLAAYEDSSANTGQWSQFVDTHDDAIEDASGVVE